MSGSELPDGPSPTARFASNGAPAASAARRALQLWSKEAQRGRRRERDRVRIEWLHGWALIELASDDPQAKTERLAEADTHLTEALTRRRRINLVELEPDILLTWGRWHRVKGNPKEAKRHAGEALMIADRCEYRLCQADIHNFLARLAMNAGDTKAARHHAEIGKERGWCDGPPHSYKPALDEAEAILKELESPQARCASWEPRDNPRTEA